MLTKQQELLIIALPETEYGRAFFAWIQEEITQLEANEEHGGKICDNPLIEDFRTQLGLKIAYKRILRKAQELKDKQREF